MKLQTGVLAKGRFFDRSLYVPLNRPYSSGHNLAKGMDLAIFGGFRGDGLVTHEDIEISEIFKLNLKMDVAGEASATLTSLSR